MRQTSDRARNRHSRYVTTAFVGLMTEAGNLDAPGVEYRIPQTGLPQEQNVSILS